MNKSKYLLTNTILFAIGEFGSKFVFYFLIPIYSTFMTTEDYGVSDLLISTINLLSPILSLGISNAVLRYTMDKHKNKGDILVISLKILGLSFLISYLFTPLSIFFPEYKAYILLLPLVYLTITGKNILSQFCKGIERTQIYVIDSIISAIISLTSTLLFIGVLKLSVYGYIYSMLLTNTISSLFLFITCKMGRYIKLGSTKQNRRQLRKELLRYSLPLVPNSLAWWVTMLSDRYMLMFFYGATASGLYSMAYKIPSIMSVFVGLFIQAWQISAIKEYENDNSLDFYNIVYRYYCSYTFVVGSGLIMLCKVIAYIMFKADFYKAWYYVPVLLMAVTIGNIQTIFGTFYAAAKNSKRMLYTSLSGAIINIIFNFLLIPKYEGVGAGIATLLSYIVVFIIRGIDVKKMIGLNILASRVMISMILLTLQSLTVMFNVHYWYLINFMIFTLIVLINIQEIKEFIISIKKTEDRG